MPHPSGTLTVRRSGMIPSNPDWQIPGMRVNEEHGRAAGPVQKMGNMGQMKMGEMSRGKAVAPGAVKMEAPKDQVDYAPRSPHTGTVATEAREHKPEANLDNTSSTRRNIHPSQAPEAPSGGHEEHPGMQGMNMPKQTTPKPPAAVPAKASPAAQKKKAPATMPDMPGMKM